MFCVFEINIFLYKNLKTNINGNTIFYWETRRANVSNPVIAAKSDAALQIAQKLFAPLNPTVNFSIGDDFSNKYNVM